MVPMMVVDSNYSSSTNTTKKSDDHMYCVDKSLDTTVKQQQKQQQQWMSLQERLSLSPVPTCTTTTTESCHNNNQSKEQPPGRTAPQLQQLDENDQHAIPTTTTMEGKEMMMGTYPDKKSSSFASIILGSSSPPKTRTKTATILLRKNSKNNTTIRKTNKKKSLNGLERWIGQVRQGILNQAASFSHNNNNNHEPPKPGHPTNTNEDTKEDNETVVPTHQEETAQSQSNKGVERTSPPTSVLTRVTAVAPAVVQKEFPPVVLWELVTRWQAVWNSTEMDAFRHQVLLVLTTFPQCFWWLLQRGVASVLGYPPLSPPQPSRLCLNTSQPTRSSSSLLGDEEETTVSSTSSSSSASSPQQDPVQRLTTTTTYRSSVVRLLQQVTSQVLVDLVIVVLPCPEIKQQRQLELQQDPTILQRLELPKFEEEEDEDEYYDSTTAEGEKGQVTHTNHRTTKELEESPYLLPVADLGLLLDGSHSTTSEEKDEDDKETTGEADYQSQEPEPQQQKVLAVDLAPLTRSGNAVLQKALDLLVEEGLRLLSQHPTVQLRNPKYHQTSQSNDDLNNINHHANPPIIDWSCQGKTRHVLKQLNQQVSLQERFATLQSETLIWSGTWVGGGGNSKNSNHHHPSSNYPLYLARGMIPLSPWELVQLLWDNERTQEYNSCSLGRQTVVDLSSLSTSAGSSGPSSPSLSSAGPTEIQQQNFIPQDQQQKKNKAFQDKYPKKQRQWRRWRNKNSNSSDCLDADKDKDNSTSTHSDSSDSVPIPAEDETTPTSTTTERMTKVVESETKVPMTSFSVHVQCLMHCRPLEEPHDQGYVIVSRSVQSGPPGTATTAVADPTNDNQNDEPRSLESNRRHQSRNQHKKKKNVKKSNKTSNTNDIIWGVNVIRSVPNHPEWTDLTSLSQVEYSLGVVPQFLASQIAIRGVLDFFETVRRLSPPPKTS